TTAASTARRLLLALLRFFSGCVLFNVQLLLALLVRLLVRFLVLDGLSLGWSLIGSFGGLGLLGRSLLGARGCAGFLRLIVGSLGFFGSRGLGAATATLVVC